MWTIWGQGIAFLGGFAIVKSLTNLMGADGYGQLSLGLTISGFMSLFVYGPISQWTLRHFSIYSERNLIGAYLYKLRTVHKYWSFIFILIAILLSPIVYWYFGFEWFLLVIVSVLFGIINGSYLTFFSLFNAQRLRKHVSLFQGGEAWLKLLFSVVLVVTLGKNGFYGLLGFSIGVLIIVLAQYYIWKKRISHKITSSSEIVDKDYKGYIYPFKYYAIFTAISIFSDRWILNMYYGAEEVGIYSALFVMANTPILLTVGLVNQFISPIIFEKVGDFNVEERIIKNNHLINLTAFVLTVILFIILIVSYYFESIIITLLTNYSFNQYPGLLWMLVLGLSIFNLAQFITLKGFSFNRPDIYIFPKAIHAIIFVSLVFVMINIYGVLGVAYAFTISSLCYLFYVIYVNNKLIKNTLIDINT